MLMEESLANMSEEDVSSSALKSEDIQALSIRPEHLEKLRAPQPPKDSQKPRGTTRVLVRKTRPREEVRRRVTVVTARPLPHDVEPQPLDYTGPGGPRFDSQGMVLPHSILGSLEDFRSEMEARGEMELVMRIPDINKQHHLEAGEHKIKEKTKVYPKSGRDLQGHALQHWHHHMAERRRQQNFISELLQKPVEDLLMNQSNTFRKIQEQKELISRGLPALHTGHGSHVGSEFWSVPQRIGDELSGITATLTQTERGKPQPITHITQPLSTRLESGNILSDGSVSRAWSQSQYLQHRQHQLKDILTELDFNQPDMDGLEVLGFSQPLTSLSVDHSVLLEEKEEEDEENEDPLALYDDVMLDVELLPALRVGGKLARWTGSTTEHQGEVGVSVRLMFEAVVGESVCSYLDLKNEGSTAIYYSWHRLALPPSFRETSAQRYTQHFYFNTDTAVILPGDTERILFTFKSVSPGILTEVWQLHTHPVLLGGASLQVTLRGVALYQDKTAEQRVAVERELEQREAVSLCRSVVYDLLYNIHTPERPSSPAQLYTTEEDHFHSSNPNLHYRSEPVEALKRLWMEAHRSKLTELNKTEDENMLPDWDLSTDHLRQVVLSLPEEDGDSESKWAKLYREDALSQYNTLILQLHLTQPSPKPLTRHCIGLQLWRELCDGLVSEALWLRQKLGLPDNNNWGDTQHEQDSWGMLKKEERMEIKESPLNKDEKKGGNVKEKEEKKGVAKTAAKDKPAEDRGFSKNKVKEEKKVWKENKDINRDLSSATASPDEDNSHQEIINPELQHQYSQTLHQQVYVLMEKMIDSLCDLLDEAQKKNEDLPKFY